MESWDKQAITEEKREAGPLLYTMSEEDIDKIGLYSWKLNHNAS
ncbi:hypothetical protein C367_05007 [Cryptococcus neoformans Ze90-1]|nr:hypothetical protein C367_05007 [Cryptococcus neoformans var. grubii Ze90-1]